VLVPGIQGRHEWMAPATAALSGAFRVLTFSLNQVPADTGRRFDSGVDLIDRLLDDAGARTATIVGHSFGGLLAAHFAARRPLRTRALVLVAAPAPAISLDRWSAVFVRHPVLALPLFAGRAGLRLLPEIVAARPTWTGRVALAAGHLARTLRWPMAVGAMAGWVQEWAGADILADCRSITAPTLVLTGEPGLDRVVPIESSLEYLRVIRGARHVVLHGAGHLGPMSMPAGFVGAITAFLAESDPTGDNRAMFANAGDPPWR
jgi:pimeloyl-ACP methyl ester carboxylesterase